MAAVSALAGSFSLPAPARALLTAHNGAAPALEPTEPRLAGSGGPVRSGALSSLHSAPDCVEGGCLGIWTYGLPGARDGLSGQRPRALGQGGHWARTCSWGRGGEPQQRWRPSGGRVTCQAKHAPGDVWALRQGCRCCRGLTCSTSYLAGVDATLRIASAQVVAVDGPSVPPAAVAEVDINELDLGLLQDIR